MNSPMKCIKPLLACCLALALVAQPLSAAIVFGGRATNGTLDNSGTNKNPAPFNLGSYTGQHGGFLGTAISPTHYITATHVGSGGNNGFFIYNDGGPNPIQYPVLQVATFNDLAIWRIDGPQTFTHWIHVYSGNNETNLPLVTMGNGTTRGDPVNTPSTSNLAGWQWGGTGTLRSWGTNTVNSIVNPGLIGTFEGDYLYFTFNRILDGNGNLMNPDGAVLSGGDSGGPTFILDPNDNQWKLAGINSLVDQVSQTPNGSGFAAALFDARGFYDGENLITGNDPVPLGSYATRISSRIDWVNSIAAVPEPGSIALVIGLAASGMGYGVYRRRQSKRLEDALV